MTTRGLAQLRGRRELAAPRESDAVLQHELQNYPSKRPRKQGSLILAVRFLFPLGCPSQLSSCVPVTLPVRLWTLQWGAVAKWLMHSNAPLSLKLVLAWRGKKKKCGIGKSIFPLSEPVLRKAAANCQRTQHMLIFLSHLF